MKRVRDRDKGEDNGAQYIDFTDRSTSQIDQLSRSIDALQPNEVDGQVLSLLSPLSILLPYLGAVSRTRTRVMSCRVDTGTFEIPKSPCNIDPWAHEHMRFSAPALTKIKSLRWPPKGGICTS